MLAQLLDILTEGGIQSMNAVARRLGVSEQMVASMADGLAQRGYLVALDESCSAACGDCSLASACVAPGTPKPRLLMLSNKGRLAAGKGTGSSPA